jgi:hypothetical protein
LPLGVMGSQEAKAKAKVSLPCKEYWFVGDYLCSQEAIELERIWMRGEWKRYFERFDCGTSLIVQRHELVLYHCRYWWTILASRGFLAFW